MLKEEVKETFSTYSADLDVDYLTNFVPVFFWLVLLSLMVWIVVSTFRNQADSSDALSASDFLKTFTSTLYVIVGLLTVVAIMLIGVNWA